VRDGEYGGYLGDGNLLGARIEHGRMRGRLLGADPDEHARIDVSLDARLVARATGTPLPSDGGAPWRDFVRLREVLRSGEEGPIRARLGATILRQLPQQQPFNEIRQQLLKSFPLEARLESGAITPIDARLILLDESSGKPVRCVILLLPEGDEWKVHQVSFRHRGNPVDPPAPNPFSDVPTT
jgi:hypothetical protein